ncbi:MAG: GNAT family N-acetyltransferase [Patescibacteria group bacterium]
MARHDVRIRNATELDRAEIVGVYQLSQLATCLPDAAACPPHLLGDRLYDRLAVRRYVAESIGRIIGHGLVEFPNTQHIPTWLHGTRHKPEHLLELGGAFVHPAFSGEGVWTSLLERRLEYVNEISKVAVAATWSQNDHVMRVFESHGAVHVGDTAAAGGEISLYRFKN